MDQSVIWAAVYQCLGVSSSKYLISIMEDTSAEEFWQLNAKELSKRFAFLPSTYIEKYMEAKKKLSLEKVSNYLEQLNIKAICFYNEQYPEQLRHIYQPPAMLYSKGTFNLGDLNIGIVGSRVATHYGKTVAKEIAKDLSNNNVTVISGLAKGIDTCAHQGALLGDGGTIAVLGTGVDLVYPNENKGLAEQIINHPHSCLISELPLGSGPLKHHFPLRNRIISGLSAGILVVEAKEKSGALITTEHALEQGKDVFAIPGPITSPLSAGVNRLIKDGAKVTLSVDDILEEYGQQTLFKEHLEHQNRIQLTKEEQKIYDEISIQPISAEEISIITKLAITDVMAALSWLEINGLIKQIIGRKFIRLG